MIFCYENIFLYVQFYLMTYINLEGKMKICEKCKLCPLPFHLAIK